MDGGELAGKLFGACVTIIGIGMAALPAGILASGLADQLRRKREALADLYRQALVSGEIDANEKKELEELRKRLGLSRSLAAEIFAEIHDTSPQSSLNFCPHCGLTLPKPPSSQAPHP